MGLVKMVWQSRWRLLPLQPSYSLEKSKFKLLWTSGSKAGFFANCGFYLNVYNIKNNVYYTQVVYIVLKTQIPNQSVSSKKLNKKISRSSDQLRP